MRERKRETKLKPETSHGRKTKTKQQAQLTFIVETVYFINKLAIMIEIERGREEEKDRDETKTRKPKET